MDVACSTLSFSKEPLEQALRRIAELEFSKIDLAVGEGSLHMTPSELVADPAAAHQRVRQGPTIGFAAVTAGLRTGSEQYAAQLDAIAHLAKQLAAPVVVIEAAPTGTPLESEIERLIAFERIVSLHGVILTVTTKAGTLTEIPAQAAELCERVHGLALTLDPSYFVCGPHQGKSFDEVFPYVKHTHLRDSGRRMDQVQVKVGRGEIEYGRIVTSLARYRYTGSLTVGIEDAMVPEDSGMDIVSEVRKLRLLLESLV